MNAAWNPIRHIATALPRAWRSIARHPGYFAIAVSSLAVALGLATTVIAHLDSLIHPDLGTPYDKRLYLGAVGGTGQTRPTDNEILGLFRAIPQVEAVAMATRTRAEYVVVGTMAGAASVWRTSPGYFDILGAKPVRGRWFRANETEGSGVALVTEDAWFHRLGATDSLDSARVIVDGLRYTVIGVVPRNLPPFVRFSFGPGARPDDVILPASLGAGMSQNSELGFTLMRAKSAISDETIIEARKRIAERLIASHGIGRWPFAVGVSPLSAFRPIQIGGYQKGMLVAVAIIVLIACANVSALMLARAVARRRDQALRLALGAGRAHLITDITAEVSLIAVAGGVAGLVIGYWSMRILAAVTPPDLPWLGFREPHWSPWVFGGLFVVVMAAVAIASLVPAFFVSGIAPVEQLKDNSGTTTGRPNKTFQALVVGELALSLCLLFGAVLVAKSAATVADFDFGYDARSVVQVSPMVSVAARPRTDPYLSEGPNGTIVRIRRREIGLDVPDAVAERLRRVSGVREASWAFDVTDQGRIVVSDEGSSVGSALLGPDLFIVGARFLQTVGLPVIAGRDFVAGDGDGDGAVILDEFAARALFVSGEAVGKLVKLDRLRGSAAWVPVVGVVPSARHAMPDDPAVPLRGSVYVSRKAAGSYRVNFVIRPERNVRDIRPAVAAVVSDLMPPQTQVETGKWVSRFDQMLTTRRFVAGMFLALSLASLVLAAAGLFGVLSYAVNQRMREFAVRVALGAQRAHVVSLVLRDGAVMVLGGTAIGGAVAMYAAFTLWEWLWGVYPVDAIALIITEGVLLGVTLIGSVLPAMRATRANPVDVMRAT